MLISQLIIAPVLILEAWFYLLWVRRQSEGAVRGYDWIVIAVAFAACAALLPAVAAHESGANDRIWRPVLSVLSSFHAFPLVLFIGVWLRKRVLRAAPARQGNVPEPGHGDA